MSEQEQHPLYAAEEKIAEIEKIVETPESLKTSELVIRLAVMSMEIDRFLEVILEFPVEEEQDDEEKRLVQLTTLYAACRETLRDELDRRVPQ